MRGPRLCRACRCRRVLHGGQVLHFERLCGRQPLLMLSSVLEESRHCRVQRELSCAFPSDGAGRRLH